MIMLENKTLGMIFYNPSLRTRLSTQRAGFNLGMDVIVMNIGSDGWALEFEDGAIMNSNKAEHIKETAEVISQYCDIIAINKFIFFTFSFFSQIFHVFSICGALHLPFAVIFT